MFSLLLLKYHAFFQIHIFEALRSSQLRANVLLSKTNRFRFRILSVLILLVSTVMKRLIYSLFLHDLQKISI
jgi:hypothetical protein